MTNIAPFPTRPAPREAAFDREIEALVAPCLADDLGVPASDVPDSYRRAQRAIDEATRRRMPVPSDEMPAPARPLAGYEAAVIGDMRSMSLAGRKALWKAGQRILDAEHHGHAVQAIHVVTATANVREVRA